MTFDPTKPVQTRSGLPARIICTDMKAGGATIAALVTHDTGGEKAYAYKADGTPYPIGVPRDLTLINTPAPAPQPTPFDPAKPVRTRDGRKARIVCTDVMYERKTMLLALVTDIDGETETAFRYLPDGRRVAGYPPASDNPFNLVNVPETHTVWVNIYMNTEGVAHLTREKADDGAKPGRIACVEVEYTVGQGL